jgi:hypothetical protein
MIIRGPDGYDSSPLQVGFNLEAAFGPTKQELLSLLETRALHLYQQGRRAEFSEG